MSAHTWTSRLITGLFTAAAAWGSVTVEIRRTVDARAALTEQRIEQHVTDQLHAATRQLAAQQQATLDSLGYALAEQTRANGPAPVIVVEAPLDSAAATRQAHLAARLDAIEMRLRLVAIAMAKHNEATQPLPKHKPTSNRWPPTK